MSTARRYGAARGCEGGARMRLVICDDHRLLVESLAVTLQAQGHEVVAVTTPRECLRAVASAHPDVCLLDLYLPAREDGLETARAILTNHPGTQVLILSGVVADALVIAKAIDLGVAGIIRKDQTVDNIEAALLRVAAGGSAFQTDVVRDVARHLTSQPRKEPWDFLTARELDVLRRMVVGESTKQMARSMQIASSTVRTYAQNVLTKLGAHSRLEASAIAVRAHLVGNDPQDAISPT